MKKYLLLFGIMFALAACDTPTPVTSESTVAPSSDHIEIYAFHGTRQCATCKNMKAYTKETLEKYFAPQLADGSIQFFIVDVDDEKNEAIAAKYEATGTALMVNKVSGGKEYIEDWSDYAFDYANESDVYIPGLKGKIAQLIQE